MQKRECDFGVDHDGYVLFKYRDEQEFTKLINFHVDSVDLFKDKLKRKHRELPKKLFVDISTWDFKGFIAKVKYEMIRDLVLDWSSFKYDYHLYIIADKDTVSRLRLHPQFSDIEREPYINIIADETIKTGTVVFSLEGNSLDRFIGQVVEGYGHE